MQRRAAILTFSPMARDAKSRGRIALHIEVTTEWMAELDAWLARQVVPPTRSDAVRVMVERFIAADIALNKARKAEAVE